MSMPVEWLQQLVQTYTRLSDKDRNIVLDSLIEASGPSQFLILSKKLPDFVFRDFIRYLPLEVCTKILYYLNGEELLSCCQVSKSWNERINNLSCLWKHLAQNKGANIEVAEVALSAEAKHVQKALFYKILYCQSDVLLKGFSTGRSIHIQDFIDKGGWRITSVGYHFGNIVTGCDDHTVQVWSVSTGLAINSITTHSVCCLTLNDTHLFTASFNANAETWDLLTGYHCKTLCGHTSAVIAIDVSPDNTYVLTGSVDKTAKLWCLKESESELVQTLSSHTDWVFHVKFLASPAGVLQFFTGDSLQANVWHMPASGAILVASYQIKADDGSRFISYYHLKQDPYQIFICHWKEAEKKSFFSKYTICPDKCEISLGIFFQISPETIKAYLLGAGTKFAVIMCSISRKDFYVVDIPKRSIITTIVTPDFCMLTRNGSTVTLCDTDWLDGFNVLQMKAGAPVFAASVGRNTVILGTWTDLVHQLSHNKKMC
ncbi:F-box/WD repeat-containing protein 2-like [Physella acuta]|uniref:F-box/WD repeat-containing protein 2-like n=1 Tax=Physella acuta TaxID=109671 RepID=UPI0027DE6119|nr:F-box/WD repeat-containing protein 2-like [Physella acuta]XP_059152924.1 F-box/WD repeat-containing protein 2-like [Physella acuta]XP_059152925.1 F-box/WD repeat-containing protein 2-like [Physella acuta]